MTYLFIHTSIPNQTKELLMDMYAEYINQDKYSAHVMKHYLALLFARILRDPGTQIDSSAKVSRIDRHYQQLLDYLKQNYRTADLSSAASEICFSRQYVCRIVREKTGATFNTLLKNIRLEILQETILRPNCMKCCVQCGSRTMIPSGKVEKETHCVIGLLLADGWGLT